ncbi:MAG TPA: LysE family translocator [Candidatus Binatia bacterium]|nr:LysE family translocator [Candidatus Binatia bacterium]
MDPGRTLAFSGVAFLVILFPGPSVLFIISRSMTLARAQALLTVVGNQAGELVQVVAVALGVGTLVAVSDVAFTVVKLAGAGYLIYLGVQTIRSRRAASADQQGAPRSTSWLRVFGQAFVVGITNPKTTVFFAAVLPQFVDRRLGHVPLQMLVLGLVWAAIALISDSAWALAASFARGWVGRSASLLRRLRWGSGAIMVGLGVSLALAGRSGSS